mmetsp:Transcript_40368/g.120418  ORF Transcript_40368/g.120418 Transcript_40368/m.120418 type:complete len:228 (+) Transcript_40368:1574-2257(+)
MPWHDPSRPSETWKSAAYGAMVAMMEMTCGSSLKMCPMTLRLPRMMAADTSMKLTLPTMARRPDTCASRGSPAPSRLPTRIVAAVATANGMLKYVSMITASIAACDAVTAGPSRPASAVVTSNDDASNASIAPPGAARRAKRTSAAGRTAAAASASSQRAEPCARRQPQQPAWPSPAGASAPPPPCERDSASMLGERSQPCGGGGASGPRKPPPSTPRAPCGSTCRP